MSQQRTQRLTRLLNKAMKSVVVRHILRDEPLSLDKYRKALRSRRTSYRPALHELALPRIYPEIKDSAVKKELLAFIREEFSEFIHEGNIHTPTFTGDAFPGHDPLEQMLWNLMKTNIAWGIEKAVQDFERCIEAKRGSFLRIALLNGVSVETEREVFKGIRLVPLPSSPEHFPIYMPDSIMFGVTTRAFTLETLLVMDYSVTPLFSKPVSAQSYSFEEALSSGEAPDFNADRFCQALSLAANSPVGSDFEWEYFDENEMSMLSQTGGHRTFWGAPRPSFASEDSVEVSEAQIVKAKGIYECWNSLNPCVQEALQVPIERWMSSKQSHDPVSAMIDLGIALESLYLHSLGNRDQLSFRFRLHAARYLGENKEERARLLSEFKEIYHWRSVAVHQGSLPSKPKVDGKSLSQADFIRRSQDLCLKSILKFMDEGKFPDWDEFILGCDGESL